MDFTVFRKRPLRVYQEGKRTFIQVPSDQVLLLRRYLESHGVLLLSQHSLMMGTHVIEIPADTDLKVFQLLLDGCARPGETGEGR